MSDWDLNQGPVSSCDRVHTITNQRTNGPVNAHLISGPRISTKYTKPGKNKVKK